MRRDITRVKHSNAQDNSKGNRGKGMVEKGMVEKGMVETGMVEKSRVHTVNPRISPHLGTHVC